MSAAEQHRAQAVKLLTEVIRGLPGWCIEAEDYAERIADSLIAAAVETCRDLKAAEDMLEREAEADSTRLG